MIIHFKIWSFTLFVVKCHTFCYVKFYLPAKIRTCQFWQCRDFEHLLLQPPSHLEYSKSLLNIVLGLVEVVRLFWLWLVGRAWRDICQTQTSHSINFVRHSNFVCLLPNLNRYLFLISEIARISLGVTLCQCRLLSNSNEIQLSAQWRQRWCGAMHEFE